MCNYDEISGLSFDYSPEGISETGANSIESTVYPNPTRGDILINADDLKRVTVANSLGQTVMDAAATSDSMIVDMREYGVGMYIVRIETKNGIGTQKVIVTE